MYEYNTRWDLIQKINEGAPLSNLDRAVMSDYTHGLEEVKSDFEAMKLLILQEVRSLVGGVA